VPNEFLPEQKKQTLDQDALTAMESVDRNLAINMSPALSQYVDFDSDSSGLFGDREIEAAKRLLKNG
jgi:hypothetical protein